MRRSWTTAGAFVILLGCRGAARQAISGGYRGRLEGIAADGRLRLFPDGRADYAATDNRTIAGGRWRIEDDLLELRLSRVEKQDGPRPERLYRGVAERVPGGLRWLGRTWRRL